LSEVDTPELRELAIARRISPLRAHASGYPTPADASEPAVRAALDAGYTDVVSATPLIVMLAALRLERSAAP
jgi:pyruvate,orthophosphate dikinase